MNPNPQIVSVTCEDGIALSATRHDGGNRAAVLIAPALGVPRRFYDRYAQFLAGHGCDVLSIDYRGMGDSGRGCDLKQLRLADWGALDLDAGLRFLREHASGKPRVLIGHSLGGQLPGLTPESETLSAMVAVGASSPDPRLYPFKPRLRMEWLWRVMVPLLTRGRTMFPARRIGFSTMDIPAGPVRDWARWGLSRGYLFDPAHGLDTARYARLSMPLLAYSFSDDDYAVRAAVDALVVRYAAARVERRHVDAPPDNSIGHFGYFNARQRDALWAETVRWLDDVLR